MKFGIACCGFLIAGLALATPAQGQVVTSFFAPGPALTSLPSAVVPVAPAGVVGTIPVRKGLFGWRTENVPVFAAPAVGTPVVAAPFAVPAASSMYQAARPVITTLPATVVPQTSFSAGAFGVPAMPAPVPNAVIQSGFRGTTPIYSSGFAPATIPVGPLMGVPVPINSFAPGSVMTMQ